LIDKHHGQLKKEYEERKELIREKKDLHEQLNTLVQTVSLLRLEKDQLKQEGDSHLHEIDLLNEKLRLKE
jgi:hypothetical protein